MPENSENAPAEGELDPGGRCADGFMPVGRRSPQEFLSCCMGTRLPQEGVCQKQGRDYNRQTWLPRKVLCGFSRDGNLALLL